MTMLRNALMLGVLMLGAGPLAAAPTNIPVGRLTDGGQVALVAGAGGYGLEVSEPGASRLLRAAPVRVEIFHSETDIKSQDVAYSAVTKSGGDVIATADVKDGPATLHVEDRYHVAGPILSIDRSVTVGGGNPGSGFTTGLMLSAPAAHFSDVNYFSPGVLYRGPGQNNERGTSGSNAFKAKHIAMREDSLPAPLLGLSFPDKSSVTLLDAAPVGDTTEEDTRANIATVLIDKRFTFGAFGASEDASGGVEFGYWMPGGVVDTAPQGRSRRRYNPMDAGLTQHYRLALRFAQKEEFPKFGRDSWRWAFGVLNPKLVSLDLDVVRRVLLDHLADRVTTINGRTGIPWIFQVVNGETWHRPDDMRAAMGFVGKNIEAADQLLREGDRDHTARGQRMRALGLKIIDTFVHNLSMKPPSGEAIDLPTGKPTVSFPPSTWRGNPGAGYRVFIRAPSEDLRRLVEAYAREKAAGRDHPEWLAWATDFADWLLPQQRPDGSFPRAWKMGTSEVIEPSSNSSYSPVPLFAELSKVMGASGRKYKDSALRAAEFVWTAQGQNGVYTGGTLDHPNVIDKEAGMLSLEAFLAAYDLTGDKKWVIRAASAGDFTESWMYLWNVPMALDAIPGEMGWKPGVSTTGVGVIAINGPGGVDQFLDWSAPAFARLYKLTGDTHYLDVSRILLRDTKGMLALPGRTFDMAGPGWQQENFNISGRRGFGGHRGWLPWVSVNHLWSIVGIEDIDPALLARMAQ
jgi:hypothetical protein